VYRDTSRYADAERLLEQVRTIFEKTLGPEHPWSAATLCELARVYRDTSRYADAERLFEQVRTIYEKTLGLRHPRVARLLVDRGELNALRGRKQEALDDYNAALTVFEAAGVRPAYRWAREAREGLKGLETV
jgi:tetratricopeptide (TPR) repeat protein